MKTRNVTKRPQNTEFYENGPLAVPAHCHAGFEQHVRPRLS